MTVSIYHNSRCSKSRNTLELIRQKGIEPDIIEYLKTPPDRATLEGLLKKLDITPRELMRKGEDVYKDMDLGNESLDDEALITAMLDNPVLIERPIVVNGNKAVIGRPPENVLAIL